VAALAGVTSVSAATGVASAQAPGAARPSFVVLLADDLGYGDLGSYGHPTIATPNLDRMAAEGLKLTSFYAAAPLCTPSRAGLLTGRFPNRSGLYRVLFPEDTAGMPREELTLAEALAGGGYRTMAIGKWHLGHRSPFLPTENGFASYFGLLYSNDMRPPRTEVPLRLHRDARPLPGEVDQGLLTERYTEEATRFIAAAGDEPFLLYVAYTMPHLPLHVSTRFTGRSRRGLYGDAVETIDWSVGAILRSLEEAGRADDTLVLFTSDNGPAMSRGEGGGSAGLLRGDKGSTYEGGMRVPCIVRWPGRIRSGRTSAEPASALDLFPTFLELAGAPSPPSTLDGRSLVPLLEGRAPRPDAPLHYFNRGFLEAVREGRWKLRETAPQGSGRTQADRIDGFLARALTERRTFTAAEVFGDDVVTELYDLDVDPGERWNVAEQNPDVVDRLRRSMRDVARGLQPGAAFDLPVDDPELTERRRIGSERPGSAELRVAPGERRPPR
jgi:arylsulfatase A-like enzyme